MGGRGKYGRCGLGSGEAGSDVDFDVDCGGRGGTQERSIAPGCRHAGSSTNIMTNVFRLEGIG